MSHKHHEALIVVHNPNSTDAARFDELQFDLKKNDIPYAEFMTNSPNAEDNIAEMKDMLPEYDATIVSGAGDGTLMQLSNAILETGKQDRITIGSLNYGGFGDISAAHNNKSTRIMNILSADTPVVERHVMTMDVNGEYERYIAAYLSLGFTALAAMRFDEPESREWMQRGPRQLKRAKSIVQLGQSYIADRTIHLPPFRLNGDETVYTHSTDVLVANNPVVGGIIKLPEPLYDTPYFGVRADIDVSHVLPNVPFGLKALAGRAPFDRVESLRIAFEHTARVPMQTEGETAYLNDVDEIFIYKDPAKVLRMLHPRGTTRP